jgi:hypothetical protein
MIGKGLTVKMKETYCEICDEQFDDEDMEDCAQCGNLCCNGCIPPPGVDGRLCNNCTVECSGCGIQISHKPTSNHLTRCGGCGSLICSDVTVTICCNLTVCSSSVECTLAATVPGRKCCDPNARICKHHPFSEFPCMICGTLACRDHACMCAAQEHVTCSFCHTDRKCKSCNISVCPLCPIENHSPQTCRSLSCEACSVDRACASHAFEFCPLCDSPREGFGWCQTCIRETSRTLVYFPTHLSKLVMGYSGAYSASLFGQIPHVDKSASSEMLEMWQDVILEEIAFGSFRNCVFDPQSDIFRRILAVARHPAVAMFYVFIEQNRPDKHRRSRILPIFLRRHLPRTPAFLLDSVQILHDMVVHRFNQRSDQDQAPLKEGDWQGLFAAAYLAAYQKRVISKISAVDVTSDD